MDRTINFDMSDINRSAAEQILSALECVSEFTIHGDRISIRARFDNSTAKVLRYFANRYSSDTNAKAFLISAGPKTTFSLRNSDQS